MIVVSALVSAALAQELPEFNSNLHRMPVDSNATLWADDSHTAPMGQPMGRFVVGWIGGPLGATADGSGEETTLVGNVVGLNVIGGIGLDRARIAFDLPVYALVTSDLENVGGAGLGDLALDAKVRINEPADTGVGLAADVRATLPTGNADGLSSGATVELSGIVDYVLEDGTVIAGNLGYRVAPKIEVPNFLTNDDLRFRVGVGHPLSENAGISGDIAGNVFLGSEGANGAPLEALLGGWGRVDSNWVIRGGAGMGLTRAVGSPSGRILLSLGYEPAADQDPDLDGILGAADACPTVPEDKDNFEDTDGCDDTDNDNDLVVDKVDGCPLIPEDKDGWLDDDGCVDATTRVKVAVVDEQGRHIGSSDAHFEGEPGAFDGRDGSEFDVIPGTYELFAKAQGFESNATTITVADGPQVEAKVVLKGEVKLATVVITVKDAAGKPVEASWSMNDSAAAPLTGGTATSSIVPGDYKVKLTAPGFVAQEFSFEAKPNGEVLIEKVLVREMGKVKIKVVDPAGNPVPAEWKTEGHYGQLPQGAGDIELPLGKHNVMATSEGFRPGSVDVEVVAGDVPVEITLTMEPAKVKVTVDKIDIQGTVYFDTGKDTIKPESFGLLDEVAQILADHPELLVVSIEGHTDSRGSDSGNLTLSDKRAKAVRAYLINKGIAADRLTSQGFGETKPIDPAENEAAWSKNRRVEFLIVKRAE